VARRDARRGHNGPRGALAPEDVVPAARFQVVKERRAHRPVTQFTQEVAPAQSNFDGTHTRTFLSL
jgi:hypothetical protein